MANVNIDPSSPPMKKSTQILYAVIFFVFVLIPVVLFLLVKDYVDTENYEQRDLAAFPYSEESLSDGVATTIDTFPSEFESWFEDHLPFRNQLLSIYGEFSYRVLKSSTSESVIVGEDGWLFYKGAQVADEDPVGDYMGTNLFTDEELALIAENFTAARDELEAMGSDFYLYFAPNKERIYSEYMPDMYGEPQEDNRMMQVVNYLRENTDLNIVCSYDVLMTYKEENPDTPIYFKYDTHWNYLGAYVGSQELVELMGYGFTSVEEVTIEDIATGTYDLARLLHLQDVLTDGPYYVISDYTSHPMIQTIEDGGLVIRYNTSDGTAPGRKLFVIGDSFSTIMYPYVACHFLDSYLTYYYNYTHGQLLREEPSTVVYEVVERYVGNMLDFTLVDGYTGDLIEG